MLDGQARDDADTANAARYRYTIREAAAYLAISTKALYAIVSRGEIDHLRTRAPLFNHDAGRQRSHRHSGRIKFSRLGLDEWIGEHRSPMSKRSDKRRTAREPENPAVASRSAALRPTRCRRFTWRPYVGPVRRARLLTTWSGRVRPVRASRGPPKIVPKTHPIQIPKAGC